VKKKLWTFYWLSVWALKAISSICVLLIESCIVGQKIYFGKCLLRRIVREEEQPCRNPCSLWDFTTMRRCDCFYLFASSRLVQGAKGGGSVGEPGGLPEELGEQQEEEAEL